MSANQLTTSVSLVNGKVQFAGTARNNAKVMMDYFPPLGDGDGYTGLEMLLLSLSCCSATAVATLLRKMNKTVSSLEVHASGIRKETAPFAFTRIDLEFVLTSADTLDEDLKRILHLAESGMCPVWAMLKGNVEIVVKTRMN